MEDTSLFAQLRPLQRKHLEMVQYIDQFCRENQIRWCLNFGSVLGAVRHAGPIPWDDDMDICMPAADYARFSQRFRECGDHERFYLQELQRCGDMVSMGKLRMNGTAFLEDVYRPFDMHQGIFVDIFILHDAADSWLGREKQKMAERYLMLKELSNRGYDKRKLVRPLMKFLRLFPADFACRGCMKQMYRWDGTNQKCYYFQQFWSQGNRKFIPKEQIFPAVRVNYEGTLLPVPRRTEAYLTRCYGDWRRIPELKEIQWSQHARNWSTTEDFRKFCPNIHSFRDEGHL